MKVLLSIIAFAALILNIKTQEIYNGNRAQVPVFNQTPWNKNQWNSPAFNRTQWFLQAFNRTQWNPQAFNRTQWNPQAFNRTQWNPQAFNGNRWNNSGNRWNGTGFNRPHFNRSQWTNHGTYWRPQSTNNTIKNNITIPNWPKWNITSPHRPRRSDPKWGNWTQNQTTHNGDLLLGYVGYLDRLLFNQTYRKESRWWSGREKIIEYPKDLPGKYVNRPETIYAIRIYNKFLDGLDADAKILSGGVGFRYVKIQLSSPWNRGFQYLVQLFGH